jgi:hypothetical protein
MQLIIRDPIERSKMKNGSLLQLPGMDRAAKQPRAVHAIRLLAIAAALVLSAFLSRRLPDDSFGLLLVFTALLVIATILRLEREGSTIGFEAVVAFPAIVIYHDPGIATVATFIATFAHAVWSGVRARHLALRSFVEAAGLTLSFFVAGLAYHAAAGRNPAPMAMASGYLLLCITWLLAHLLFTILAAPELASSRTVARMLGEQGKVILLISPVVAVEVLVWQPYGPGGLSIAFLPVLLAAYVMKSEADTDQQNILLTERNRQLGMLSRNSTALLAAESIGDSLSLLTAQLSGNDRRSASDRLPIRAMRARTRRDRHVGQPEKLSRARARDGARLTAGRGRLSTERPRRVPARHGDPDDGNRIRRARLRIM